jgi:hypothetical protein
MIRVHMAPASLAFKKIKSNEIWSLIIKPVAAVNQSIGSKLRPSDPYNEESMALSVECELAHLKELELKIFA